MRGIYEKHRNTIGKTQEQLPADIGHMLEKHRKGIGKLKEKQSKNIRHAWRKYRKRKRKT